MTETSSHEFPHPIYQENVLKPAFRGASAHLFEPMLEANRAHVVMLAGQKIITPANAAALLSAIAQVAASGLESLTFRPGVEDLFFLVEGRLIELCGPEYGGNLQLARSRNDLGHALARIALRQELLELHGRLLQLRSTVLTLARKHIHTVMPGYTHTQPAQPATFAHYLAGVLSFLQRDTARLNRAYETNNQSPLGAAAFTGTGFNVDRQILAAFLGFSGVIVSTHDSIAASDHQTDISAALASLAVNLSRVTHDLLFRATRESGAIHIDDSFIQISSIMPQKRNPVVLEHLRARLSRLIGLAQTVVVQCHNIPYGDTQDIEDEIEPTLFKGIETAGHVLALYDAVFQSLKLNVEHLRTEAGVGFTTVTELADTLVRHAKLPFRTAHHIVSRLVKVLHDQGLDTADVTAELLAEVSAEVLGQSLVLESYQLEQALDPVAFVEARHGLGGVAPSATSKLLDDLATVLQNDRDWLQGEQERLAGCHQRLDEAADQLLSVSG